MLPESGPISFESINLELRKNKNSPFNIGSEEARYLAGVPSGPIKISDFYGKGLHDITFTGLSNLNYNGSSKLSHTITKRVPNYIIPTITGDNYTVVGNTFIFNGFIKTETFGSFVYNNTVYTSNSDLGSFMPTNLYGLYSMDNYVLLLNKNDIGGLGNIYLGEDNLGSPYPVRATEEHQFKINKLYINSNVNQTIEAMSGYTPTRQGFQFTGFSTERKGSVLGAIDNPGKHFKSGTTLYAQWVDASAVVNLVIEGKGRVQDTLIKVPLVDSNGNPDISKTAQFDVKSIPMPISNIGWEFVGFMLNGKIIDKPITVSYDKTTKIVVKFRKI